MSRRHSPPDSESVHGSPLGIDGARFALHTEAFARNPHAVYAAMREACGAVAPVELSPGVGALLVLDYRLAVRILHDPWHFPADPRRWQDSIPDDCPVKPMLEWRPNSLRSGPQEQPRYRKPTVAALAGVDLHRLRAVTESNAVTLINRFCGSGSADLRAQYAFPLVFEVLNALIGCPPGIGARLVPAFAAMFDATDPDNVNTILAGALGELVDLKHRAPSTDITSRLIAHEHRLDRGEVIQQLVTLYSACEPLVNLITNTIHGALTDDHLAGGLLSGNLATPAALDRVLAVDPPIANLCASWPNQPIYIPGHEVGLTEGVWFPADQPVLISMAACASDPKIGAVPDSYVHNSSSLAFGTGPHACPAQAPARLIALDAIDHLLDALPEMRLGVPAGQLRWRPGPFHRALAHLPVVFDPAPPLHTAVPPRVSLPPHLSR